MNTQPTMRATRLPADQTLTLDGRLDEAAWRATPSYAMSLSRSDADAGTTPMEGGTVRLLWDDDHLYVGIELIDSDVVQEDDRDQQHHYLTGDVAEVFIGPVHDGQVRYYWELYATPHGRRTAFFFPSRGRIGLPGCIGDSLALRVGAHVDGRLNDWTQRDRGWSAELAIPRKGLAQRGVALEPGKPWRIFIGRYNYSAYLPDRELTMCPPMPVMSFHRHEHWATLELAAS